MSITKEKKQEVIKNYAINESDTGSVEVQVAVLTEKILSLTQHVNANKKDFSSRRGLLMMVSRRRGLLDYLKKTDEERYKKLIDALGLKR